MTFRWVIENRLAGCHRPGYYGSNLMPVSVGQVERWIEARQADGIQSIICLLDDEHLDCYPDLPDGLLAFYREAGFNVFHLPVADTGWSPLNGDQLELVWQAFQRLPPPVLVHCSAGIQRTAAALDHILIKLRQGGST